MSEDHISVSEFVSVVRDVTANGNLSAEFKYFIEQLYERTTGKAERYLPAAEHHWFRMGTTGYGVADTPKMMSRQMFQEDLSEEDKAALAAMDEELSQAISRIDESRMEIEASAARTRVLREETNVLLASIGG